MIENGRIIGLGLALVDHKIKNKTVCLPQNKDNLPFFLDENSSITNISAGGPICNTLTAFISYLPQQSIVQLYSAIGDDKNGDFFRQHTSEKLGHPQIKSSKPTGLWACVIDESTNEIKEKLSYYGAAQTVSISKKDVGSEKNTIFMTDISSCKFPDILNQALDALPVLKREGGLFVLSLNGARLSAVSNSYLDSMFRSLPYQPQIIFANQAELLYITGKTNLNDAIHTAFPASQLLITTCGKDGAVIRFNGDMITIPSYNIEKDKFADETGAGDAFMGTMLAILYPRLFSMDKKIITKAAKIASYAGALTTQTLNSRVANEQAVLIQKYAQSVD